MIDATMTRRADDEVVGALDLRTARRLATLTAEQDPAIVAAAALAVAAPRGGHVCVDLAEVAGRVVGPDGEVLLDAEQDVDRWVRSLLASPMARAGGDEDRVAPLVVDGTRCYLDRYWAYEERLRAAVTDRSGEVALPDDVATITAVLDEVAPHDAPDGAGPATDRQRLAVANGLLRPLSVLSGGPGTGKTHTVVSILAGHVALAARRGARAPRLVIAAPTGKAAARMEQAIREAVAERGFGSEVTEALEELRGATVHRLLGYQRHAPTRFRRDAQHPLDVDVVVVDEASMVPLSMMAKLVAAVPPRASLVLVGDREQLASVEAGAVLGDLCGPRPPGSSLRVSPGWAEALADVTGEPVSEDAQLMAEPGVWDGIVQLERFRRFGPDTGIGAVARAIQRVEDDATEVIELMTGRRTEVGAAQDAYDDVELIAPTSRGLPPAVRDEVVAALDPYLDAVVAGDGASALAAIDDVRILCAVRSGVLGVDAVGRAVEEWLGDDPRIRPTPGTAYAGRPVMVTRNDYDLGLMNGDVGVTLMVDGRLVIAFPGVDGTVRHVPAIRVADCETVWAMTIHKSQGSQFGHPIVVLPDAGRGARIVSRELVYTGITRASTRVTVVATEEALRAAVRRPVRRATGLADRLWPPS